MCHLECDIGRSAKDISECVSSEGNASFNSVVAIFVQVHQTSISNCLRCLEDNGLCRPPIVVIVAESASKSFDLNDNVYCPKSTKTIQIKCRNMEFFELLLLTATTDEHIL